ncbi:o-methyltransferase-like protein [Apiospora arundinis]
MGSVAVENDLITGAEELLAALKSQQPLTNANRAALLRQVDKLRCGLQGPAEAMNFQGTFNMFTPVMNALVEHRVFDLVPLDGNIGLEALASKIGWESAVLVRFINVVLIQGILEEPEPRLYKHSPSSIAFREDRMRSYYQLGSWSVPSWWKVSDYLKTHAPEDLYNNLKSPFSYWRGAEGKTYYQLLEEDPAFSDVWHKGMAQAAPFNPVLGMFPFRDMRKAVEAEPDRAFVVDVGGGRGNALVDMMKECGGSFGAPMVLQDMKEVLQGDDPVRIEGVQVMPHDFYNEQPVKNAHIYYMRKVMHNYYDDKCRTILRPIVEAMGPTSRLLFGDMILPESAKPGDDALPFCMDLRMLMIGGTERSESQWKALLESVGLAIVKIWRLPGAPHQATIETMLRGN